MNKALLREIICPRGERVRYTDEKNTAVVLQVVRLGRDAKTERGVVTSVCVCVCVCVWRCPERLHQRHSEKEF